MTSAYSRSIHKFHRRVIGGDIDPPYADRPPIVLNRPAIVRPHWPTPAYTIHLRPPTYAYRPPIGGPIGGRRCTFMPTEVVCILLASVIDG